MPKQVIVIMDDHYPFGQCEESTSENTRVLVRKIYQVSVQDRNKLLQKASIIRKLKCQQLIKIQSILQEEESIHFLYEYVPIRLQTWISNINDQFIQNFRDQLIKFSSYLANNFIKIDFTIKNIGMDHNYGAKYFLDTSFVYDSSLNKQRLKSQYIRDISNLFKPYILNNQQQEQIADSGKNSAKNSEPLQKKDLNNKNKNAAISPPTYNEQPFKQPSSNKTKEKLQKYYQQMNASMDVQNQKILQEFMDVLDDQQQQQDHIPKSSNNMPQNRSVPPVYQHKFDPRQQQSKQFATKKNQVSIGSSKPQNNPFRNNLNPNDNNGYQINNGYQNSIPAQNNQSNNNYQNNQYQAQLNQHQAEQQNKLKQSGSNMTSQAHGNAMTTPPKMVKNSQLNQEQPQVQEQVVWRDSDDLKNRIKKAIQNSKTIIKRFKSIKQTK